VPPDNCFTISAATRQSIEQVLGRVVEELRAVPAPMREPVEPNEPPLTWPIPEVDPNLFTIEQDEAGWRVRGRKIERLLAMTNFDQPEALDRVQRVLRASGISEALAEAGVQDGDTVYIGNTELSWSETETYG
jgi:GTP-binding protein